MRKGVRKHGRVTATRKVTESFTMVEMFERFMWFKNSEGLAPRTVEEYGQHFQWLCDYFGKDLSREEMTTEAFLGWVDFMTHEKQLKPNTVNIRIRTMRAFLRYCFMENLIDEPIHERFKPIKVAEEVIEALSVAEIKSLLNNFDESTFVGFRDKVMVMVLLDSMVRISELLAMKRSNVDFKAGIIKLEAMNTKTRKAREVPLSTKTMKLLKEYMDESSDFGEDLLFLTYDGREMLSNTWRTRLHEVAELSGVKKAVRPHILRHTGALLYITNGGDPFSLQKILGHTDMSMTRKYVNMTNLDVKRQHNSFSPLRHVFR
ncbi:tyrosine-type recombinase/integrase [Neobacillus cucumis]|uniref:tyrosine-type recombinase/integrase n=1 Tax=Neobacillus cucumis TaxID=1740721 RepID=UPI0018E041EF|nr:tyrosine-type recombinase/integrase [Neobacillus cucumis]MBI0576759.1 tyrosine-type recombinase/integrase [Neobacillus cucumis]